MKKRVALIFVLSAVMLSFCSVGVISLYRTKNSAYATDIVFLSATEDDKIGTTQSFVAGEQIELYLGAKDKKLPTTVMDDKKPFNLLSWKIADESIVSVGYNYELTPLKYGLTYISCQYANGKTYNYNIIVHNDTEYVKDVTIEGKSAAQTKNFKLNLGQEYPLNLKVSSSCDLAQVKVIITSTYFVDKPDENGKTVKERIDGDQFLEITSNGGLLVTGVGVCNVRIQSATNRNDPGVSFQVESKFGNDKIKTAVEKYFSSDGSNETLYQLDGVYRKEDLNGIRKLSFNEMLDLDALPQIMPAVKEVKFSLLTGNPASKTYKIPFGNIKYTIEGLEDKPYSFSLLVTGNKIESAKNEIEVTLKNLILRSSSTPIDLSKVENATIKIEGKCEFKATEDAQAISAQNLTVIIGNGADLSIIGSDGRNGTSAQPQGKDGQEAILASGSVSVNGPQGQKANLTIIGGNGGNGAIPSGGGVKGGNGGDGGAAIFAKNINCNGNIILDVVGGNGGHGADGKDGIQPTAKPTASRGRTPDATGDRGEDGDIGGIGGDGGRGGNGGEGLVATELISFQRGSITIVSGNGGNGGNGANGSTGGTGGKGGTGGGGYKWNQFPFWLDSDGGQGGTGGQGGQGGRGGDGGDSANCIKATTLKIRETELISATEGNAGFGGNGGNGGNGGQGGQGGNASTGNWDSATNGSGGYGGQGGKGGSGGNSGHINGAISVTEINNIAVNIYVHLGTFATKQAFCGKPGAGGFGGKHGDYDHNGTDRSSEQATAGNNEGVFDGVIFTNRINYPSEWSYIIFVQ